VASRWWSDDEQLIGVLKEALNAERGAPREVLDAGRAAWVWRTIDAELAVLTYDSAAGARGEPASPRALTFAWNDLTIELDVTRDALVGQITPARAGEAVVVRIGTEEAAFAVTDELGIFALRPVPAEPFRLLVRAMDGTAVLTGWVSP
jgi:hypothetical protein